ncbi:ATP-binding protein [Streptomyces sp. NBC_01304]|uniref:ATP-binding protein n=1 Tax=Streptomyces sp. NBC_01304 TaxID=2903818 RepID=UPI002E13C3CE|nr:ATP-binding protein [Streptomyces sp. NBC_01304]
MPKTISTTDVPHTYTLYCPALSTSPRIARTFIATVLRSQALDHLNEAATLCTSELVTNAVVHARGPGATLELAIEATYVRVEVRDSDDRPPVLREGYDAESGRGLWLVDALSEGRWGVEPGETGGGKAVWFELRTCGGMEAALKRGEAQG